MEASRVMSLEPRIYRMGTDRKKAMLARPVLGLVGHLQRPLQASLRPPFQSPSSIRFANDLGLTLADLRSPSFYLPRRGALPRAAGLFA